MRLLPPLESLPFSSPSVEPHITLASFPSSTSIDDLRTALLRKKTQLDLFNTSEEKLTLEFRALSTGEAYFRSVLIDIVLSPALKALHEIVHNALPNSQPKSPRFPHLSLLYIPDEYAVYRETTRNVLWSTYGRLLQAKEGDGESRVGFELEPGEGKVLMDGFAATEVQIVNCEGFPEEWNVLERIDLQQLSNSLHDSEALGERA